MNPSIKLLLIIIISLEISFTNHLTANTFIILISVIFLFVHHISKQSFFKLMLVPLIPALALAITIRWFSPSHSWWFATILVSRLYAYCFLGALITVSTTPLELARSLEQNAHLPSQYVYGTLAAVNMVPRTIQEVKIIRVAGQMRGVQLSFWSPRLYFKAVLAAISWSDHLAQAMESQGFVEGQARTYAHPIKVSFRDWGLFFAWIILLQLCLTFFP